MSYSGNLNPNVVKTALDDIFMQEWDYKLHPGYVDATNPLVFIQDATDRGAEIQEIFKGVGLWAQRAEEQDIEGEDPRVKNTKTLTVLNFAKSIDISKNLFDDNMHGAYEKMIRDFAEKGRLTRDDNAFGLYRGSFATYTTADGAYIVSDSHTTISGTTVDNKLAAALSETSLNDAIVMLSEQKDQSGTVVGKVPSVLLVPPKLFKKACELVGSELQADTANNNMNVYSSKYALMIATSNRLGAAAGGSDTAWWLLGKNHSIYRYVRQGIVTDLVDYKYQRNNNYIYKGEFREVVGAWDYVGIVGSTI